MESDEAAIKRMEGELRLLAAYMQGETPDKNTQTPEQVEAIESQVQEIVERYTPYRATA